MICCCLTFAGLLIVVRGVLATFAVDPADLLTASDLVGQGNDTHIKAAQRAPKIMHQVWLSDVDEPMPARWRAASASCRTQHPDYEYRYWTTSTARSFVAEHYAPYLGVYDSYHYRIQRADAFRYFVLHRLGGVYLDIDVQCRRSLDPLLAYDFVAPATYPFGVGNDVIVASPRHDLLAQVIEALPRTAHTYGTQYTTVLLSTGPLLLSALVAGFHDRRAAGVRILAPRLYGKHARGDPGALFVHHFASSWHGGDVVVCSWLCRCLLAGLLIVARASHVRTARCVAQKLWTSDRRLWHDFEDGSEMPLLTDRDDGVP
jgi:mannosyltransferase OCH1-like enzyme